MTSLTTVVWFANDRMASTERLCALVSDVCYTVGIRKSAIPCAQPVPGFFIANRGPTREVHDDGLVVVGGSRYAVD